MPSVLSHSGREWMLGWGRGGEMSSDIQTLSLPVVLPLQLPVFRGIRSCDFSEAAPLSTIFNTY